MVQLALRVQDCLFNVMAASPILRDQMGHAGRKLFQDQFTAAVMIKTTLAVYGAVLRGSSNRVSDEVKRSRICQGVAIPARAEKLAEESICDELSIDSVTMAQTPVRLRAMNSYMSAIWQLLNIRQR